ncbi:MAG: GtrA family protein [Proteobacteria bacterium]|nr:GtrA family protein [Burkholderiales bacterium]
MKTLLARSADAGKVQWQRHRLFILFVLASGASVPVNIAARLLFSVYMPFEAAVLLSHLVGMATAFVLNRQFVFGRSGRSASSDLSRFALVNVVSAAQTWIVSVGLLRWAFPWIGFHTQPELVSHVIGLGFASVTAFAGHRHFSFGKAVNR